MQSDIKLQADRPNPDFHRLASSHFAYGVLTFHRATCSAPRPAGR